VRFPARLTIEASLVQGLRYGENPHQAAAFYRPAGASWGLAAAAQLHGPELGYNNLLDWSAALALLLEFEDPAAVVIKHTNPCGVALGRSVSEAVRRAKACDPVSIYGGIVGVNRRLDLEVVKELSGILLEVLFAPEFEPDALDELRMTKKKCRVFQLPCTRAAYGRGCPSTGACSAACSSRTRTKRISIRARSPWCLAGRPPTPRWPRSGSPGGSPSTPSPMPSSSARPSRWSAWERDR
jgi:hypothetical protein